MKRSSENPIIKQMKGSCFTWGRQDYFSPCPVDHRRRTTGSIPTRVGLEHIAVGVKNIDDLTAIAKALDEASIKHSGIHLDNHSNKEKIWLDDPDKIRVEFYIRPGGSADNASA